MRNQDLCRSLNLLWVKFKELYSDDFEGARVGRGVFDMDALIANSRLRTSLRELDEFDACVEVIEGDPQCAELLGRTVNIIGINWPVGDAKRLVENFIIDLAFNHPNDFDERFVIFVDLFYSDLVSVRSVSRLHSFDSDEDVIVLDDQTRIVKEPFQEEMRLAQLAYPTELVYEFNRSGFVIEYVTRHKKLVGQDGSKEEYQDGEAEISGALDLVVGALRLFESSAVARSSTIEMHTDMIVRLLGGNTHVVSVPVGGVCSISGDAVATVVDLFQKVKANRDVADFVNALNRLSYGMERNRVIDKVIDYMIGLEILYIPRGTYELRFRVALNAALMLADELTERQRFFRELREMYDARSGIVHEGKSSDATPDRLLMLENALRESLKLYLEDSSRFSHESLMDAVLG